MTTDKNLSPIFPGCGGVAGGPGYVGEEATVDVSGGAHTLAMWKVAREIARNIDDREAEGNSFGRWGQRVNTPGESATVPTRIIPPWAKNEGTRTTFAVETVKWAALAEERAREEEYSKKSRRTERRMYFALVVLALVLFGLFGLFLWFILDENGKIPSDFLPFGLLGAVPPIALLVSPLLLLIQVLRDDKKNYDALCYAAVCEQRSVRAMDINREQPESPAPAGWDSDGNSRPPVGGDSGHFHPARLHPSRPFNIAPARDENSGMTTRGGLFHTLGAWERQK